MKTKSNTRENVAVLPQICNLIPANLVSKAVNRVREQHGIKVCTRTFSVWSQVVSLMFCHLAHCLSLNDICDALGFHCGLLNRARNATVPCRNTLSHANRTRSSEIIKAIYWDVLKHYQQSCTPFFQKGARCYFRMPRRFKRVVRAIETFFKEIKQTLQLRTFVGFSRNAIEWQLWSAMLVYLLLRILAWQGK